MKKRIAVFASGGGSNALKIIDHFKSSEKALVGLVVTNNIEAGIIEKLSDQTIPLHIEAKPTGVSLLNILRGFDIDFIALAGYLKKIPDELVKAYDQNMVNIHPALLPKYGGKGMYGMNVHRAVLQAGEQISGMTIHYVNEHYDEGSIIEQHQCDISQLKTADEIQKAVLQLEHQFYAPCIEKLL